MDVIHPFNKSPCMQINLKQIHMINVYHQMLFKQQPVPYKIWLLNFANVNRHISIVNNLFSDYHWSLNMYLELKSRKENFNRIMPDLEIDMHSNPFGDQNDPDKNFDQISVWMRKLEMELFLLNLFLVNLGRSIAINYTKCWIFRKTR